MKLNNSLKMDNARIIIKYESKDARACDSQSRSAMQTASETEDWVKAGRAYAHPPSGEDIVISGIAGSYPECRNIYEYRDNLAAKVDMITSDDRRWTGVHPEIPSRAGKVLDVEKFDAGFFGVHPRQSHAVEPMCRILMEKCFECLLDAGCNPKEFEGSRTGLYVGAWATESETFWFNERRDPAAYAMIGHHRSMMAARAAYALGLQGPAYVTDSGCSSSLFALDHAYRAMREGKCERAIVVGAHLCVHPYITLQFSRLGVLSTDGACKCFDEAANGYARSEAICAIVLQKSRDAKRVYAHLKHCKVNVDGYKEQGITYPSGQAQRALLSDVYLESQVDPADVSFVEAHGTGTVVGDAVELGTIRDIYLKSRSRPLYIGSVKSNIGHTEGTSGLSSLSKIILGYEGRKILPNIHFKEPRRCITALCDGAMIPVTDCVPWPDHHGLVGINSFGFGGANSHVLLKWNERTKEKHTLNPYMGVPMVVCVSGRTSESVQTILEDVKAKWNDPEYIRLIHDIFRFDIMGHNFRGFVKITMENISTEVAGYSNGKPKLVYNFSGTGQSWMHVIAQLCNLKPFYNSYQKIQNVTTSLGYDLNKGQSAKSSSEFLIAICAQIAIADTLGELNLIPDLYCGSAFSQLVCAYLDGCLTLGEIIKWSIEVDSGKEGCQLAQILDAFQRKSDKWRTKSEIENYGVKHTLTINFGSPNSLSNTINMLPLRGQSILNHFLSAIGKIFLAGFSLHLHHLYPPIKFPVTSGTPMISPLIQWDHKRDWYVSSFRSQDQTEGIKKGFVHFNINTNDDFWKYLAGHVIDGRTLFPATGYLVLVWDALGIITGKFTASMRIVFENVHFLKFATLPTSGVLSVTVMICAGSSNFEIVEDGTTIVTGTIREETKAEDIFENSNLPPKSAILLTEKDIYTELKLRGYNYRGAFTSLKQVDLFVSSGVVEWSKNWVTFLDCMLQMQILQLDTRGLYIPTGLMRLQIDAAALSTFNKGQRIPVYAYKNSKIIRSAGIEIRGLNTRMINRRRCPEPCLEKYVFVSNDAQLSLKDSVRITIQVALENFALANLKIIEHWPATYQGAQRELLSPLIQDALNYIPLIEANLSVFAKDLNVDLQKRGIRIKDRLISSETNCYLIVVDRFTLETDLNQVEIFAKALIPQGYLLIRESHMDNMKLNNFSCLLRHQVSATEYLHLFQRQTQRMQQDYLKYEDNWAFLANLKNLVASSSHGIILYSNQEINGLLGFTMCLKKELIIPQIRCLILKRNSSEEDDIDLSLYTEQLNKGYAVNVLENGVWGTYRYLPINEESTRKIKVQHAFVNTLNRGDLSTLSWIQGAINRNDSDVVQVHYASVNFRDVITANGRIGVDTVTANRLGQECVQGFEYSGMDSKGQRVMGMLTSGALSTLVKADPDLLLPVPEYWSLEEAATIPIVYCTVLYAFFIKAGGLREGQRILIHSGTGGVGQAAISIALFYNCQVFATVGTPEKKRYLCQSFPNLNPANIGNSRDTSFENLILHRTNNKGVDIVLNSLSEDKLQSSLKCLADNGHHLEIGKFDLAEDNELDTFIFERGITFHGIMLDTLFTQLPAAKRLLITHLQMAIENGAVTPLERSLFQRDETERAFRYMTSGKHVGKVVIQIRDNAQPQDLFPAVPRFHCPLNKSCLVVGGLGGFGLEICDWLVVRGCRELVITSRNGCQSGYQHYRINTWRQYGVTVTILREDLQTETTCQNILEKLPHLHAIFNLAVVLHDGLLENQTEKQLEAVLNAKVTTTRHLDRFSRELCPNLKYFVVFSSFVSGRGNIGQSNYGMANSIIERLMVHRQREHLPALAIQWGLIADVGLGAQRTAGHLERQIAGTSPQRISNCFEVIDIYLASAHPVLSSNVIVKKRNANTRSHNIVESIVSAMGLRSLKTVSWHSTLPEIGMDSLMALEIKQILERDFELFMSLNDIRNLTFSKLQHLQNEKSPKHYQAIKTKTDENNISLRVTYITDEECSKKPTISMQSQNPRSKVLAFVIPGIEGFAAILSNLCSKLQCRALALQLIYDNLPDTLEDIARLLLASILDNLTSTQPFIIIAYSYGTVVALEISKILEQEYGNRGYLILIDGSYELMQKMSHKQINMTSPDEFQISLLCSLVWTIPMELQQIYRQEMLRLENFEKRVDFLISKVQDSKVSKSYMRKIALVIYKRVKAIADFRGSSYKLQSVIHLLKPTRPIIMDIEEDYLLNKIAQHPVHVELYDDDHYTILDSDQVAADINKIISGAM